jgi:hypothetical protein
MLPKLTGKRLLVLAFAAGLLGVQLATQIVDTGPLLWPLVPYEMYSAAHPPGSTIAIEELVLVDGAGTARPLTHRDVHMPMFRYFDLLGAVAQSGPEGGPAVELLNHLLVHHFGSAYPRAQVWTRTFVIGPDGLESRNPARRLARAWELP